MRESTNYKLCTAGEGAVTEHLLSVFGYLQICILST